MPSITKKKKSTKAKKMTAQKRDVNGPGNEKIRLRAYQIYLEKGSLSGCDLDHWLEAERQLNVQK